MKPFTEFLKHRSLIIGIILMFLYTWTIDLSNSGVLLVKVPFVVGLTVGWGFIIISLLMTRITLGKEATVTLLKRFLLWRMNWKWYLVAILLLPALQIISVVLTAWLTGMPTDFSHPMVRDVVPLSAPLLILVIPWFLFEMISNGEEIGWRGYVLPRLQTKYNALVASLIVGVIWSVWHLPKFFGAGTSGERSFAWFTVFCLAAAVLYTWLYNNTRQSTTRHTLPRHQQHRWDVSACFVCSNRRGYVKPDDRALHHRGNRCDLRRGSRTAIRDGRKASTELNV